MIAWQMMSLAVQLYDNHCRCFPTSVAQTPWARLEWEERQNWILTASEQFDQHFTKDGLFRIVEGK
jgi:hypothetical protein